MILTLGIIPARGGSKRIPRKNLAPVGGKPMIVWAVEAANAAKRLDACIVSTDDADIAEVAKAAGGDVPFLRPAELSGDGAQSEQVVNHALEWVARHRNWHPAWAVLLQPTSPLRTAEDIDAAIHEAETSRPSLVASVVTYPPCWTFDMAADRRLKRRPARLAVLNGAIYVYRVESQRIALEEEVIGYPMPRERSVDVDTIEDLAMADAIRRLACH